VVTGELEGQGTFLAFIWIARGWGKGEVYTKPVIQIKFYDM